MKSPFFDKNVRKTDFVHMVDPKGIEPSTLRMRTVRSPRLSYGPKSTVPKAEQKNKQYEIIDVAENRTLCSPS